jgi:hypothetical protein
MVITDPLNPITSFRRPAGNEPGGVFPSALRVIEMTFLEQRVNGCTRDDKRRFHVADQPNHSIDACQPFGRQIIRS